ncbi:MAG: hypothetical protein PHP62_01195 [Candidatus Moranbacteria bacterium]|nr:hypothetical protein [Candidatus Moranbacteria bacterium]
MEKIKGWLYFKYGFNVPTKFIWLILILISSTLFLLGLLLINNLSRTKGIDPTKNIGTPGTQIPGAPPGVLYVNPPIAK